MDEKTICFIRSGNIETIIGMHGLLYEYFAKVFDNLIFLDVSKVFTSTLTSVGFTNEGAYNKLPSKFRIVSPKSFFECRNFLKAHRMVAVCHFSEKWDDWYIHHYIKKYSIPLIYIDTHSLIANFQGRKSSFSDFKRKLKNLTARVCGRFTSYDFLANVDTYFVSDKHKAEKKRHSSRCKEVVVTNSRFYDNLLISNHKLSTDYVVFLDSMIPYHGDQFRFGFQPINRELYYKNLNTLLDTVSRILRKELVICLHPKYDEENLQRDFGMRKAVKYRTDEFAAKAELVLFHESSSINNAVIYGKKVIQLMGKHFNDFTRRNCEAYNKVFSFTTLDMFECRESSIKEILYGLKVDSEKYDDFLSNHIITSGQKGVPSYVQIADHIRNKYLSSKQLF